MFDAHHRMLRDAILASGGDEVKWEGDGVMAAFTSTAAAVRCAIAMQEGVRRPIDGELIEMRIRLNVGEAYQEDGDYFGTTVVIAQRLCSQADQGQILCS